MKNELKILGSLPSQGKLKNNQGILKGEVSLLPLEVKWFDWFGLVCFANKNKNCQLSYNWFQTSQTSQMYSDTSPFSIPWNN